MASKLEKAQDEYEKLLRDLADRAQMLDMFEQADEKVLEAHNKAKEALSDRKLELEFIESEIENFQVTDKEQRKAVDDEITELEAQIKQDEKIIDVKKSKSFPLKQKLAGEEYDFKFAEKGMKDETNKRNKAKNTEDFDRAKIHEENIKHMKIELMKRRKGMEELRRKIREFEKPIKKLEKSMKAAGERIAELELKLDEMDESSNEEMLEELQRQKTAKEKEVKRAELLVVDTLADAGEDLFEKKVSHPVLDKFYADIDKVAKEIDKLQGEEKDK